MLTRWFADTGATPMSPGVGDVVSPNSRTVEYHRPARNSARYSSGTDMSLGMISANPHHASSAITNPRTVQGPSHAHDRVHAPSAFRSPPINASTGYDSPSSMQPSRPAPVPPGSSSRRDSTGPTSPAQAYGTGAAASTSRAGYNPKSATDSPKPNRYSAGPTPTSMGMTSANGAPPPRPTRAGTLPLDRQWGAMNGVQSGNAFDPMSPGLTSGRTPSGPPASTQSSNPSQPTPPPLQHQPFSAPGNPYSMEKDFDDKVGLGVPMGVVEPREKELPREPLPTGRNRSGTGKSMKDKKSVFGVLSGEPVESGMMDMSLIIFLCVRTVDERFENTGHFYTIRSHTSHSCWL